MFSSGKILGFCSLRDGLSQLIIWGEVQFRWTNLFAIECMRRCHGYANNRGKATNFKANDSKKRVWGLLLISREDESKRPQFVSKRQNSRLASDDSKRKAPQGRNFKIHFHQLNLRRIQQPHSSNLRNATTAENPKSLTSSSASRQAADFKLSSPQISSSKLQLNAGDW